MNLKLVIERAGPALSIQDLGRTGMQAQGVPVAGAMDRIGLRLANALVGNDHDAAALEIRLVGPTLRVKGGPARFALFGTAADVEMLGQSRKLIPSMRSFVVPPETPFRIGALQDTTCCYLAVSGGIDLEPVFGSLATYAPAGIGGFEGRTLNDGDEICLKADTISAVGDLAFPGPFAYDESKPIRITLGPQDSYFTEDALRTLAMEEFTISKAMNRMGVKLDGPTLVHRDEYNIASDGIVTGAIQVPGSGQAIVLMADRQTTGGYPKIATIISADLPRFAKRLPGASLRFEVVDVADAENIRRQQETELQRYIESAIHLPPEDAGLMMRLLQENLISGVTGG